MDFFKIVFFSRLRLTEANVFFFFFFFLFDYGPGHTVHRVLMATRSGRSPLEEPSESNFLVVPRDLSLREFHNDRQSYAIFHSSNTYRRTLSSINIWTISDDNGKILLNFMVAWNLIAIFEVMSFRTFPLYTPADCATIKKIYSTK